MKLSLNEKYFFNIEQFNNILAFIQSQTIKVCEEIVLPSLRTEFQDNYKTRDNFILSPFTKLLEENKVENEIYLKHLDRNIYANHVYSDIAELKILKNERDSSNENYSELEKNIYSLTSNKQVLNVKQELQQFLFDTNISEDILNNSIESMLKITSKLELDLKKAIEQQMNQTANKYIRLNQYGSHQQIGESEEKNINIVANFCKIYSKVFFELLQREENVYRKELEQAVLTLIKIENNEEILIEKIHAPDFFTNTVLNNDKIEKSKEQKIEEAYIKIKSLKNNLFDKFKQLTQENNDLPPIHKMKNLIEDGYSLASAFTKLKINSFSNKPNFKDILSKEKEALQLRLDTYKDIIKIPNLYNYMKEVDLSHNKKVGIIIDDLPFYNSTKEAFENGQQILLASLREVAIKGSIDVINEIELIGNQNDSDI